MSRQVEEMLAGLDPGLQALIKSSLLPGADEKERRIASGVFDDSGIRAKVREITSNIDSDFSHYQNDPVGFVETEFGEYVPPDCVALMESVRDYRATIAKSGNATGKSWSAGRIALWFLLAHPGSQVYTAAAPPESNLRNILWGEIGSLLYKHRDKHLVNFKINDLRVRHKGNDKYFLTGVTIPTSGTSAKREAAFSGKHAPHMLFILDEADGIPPEVYKGIESCMSGGHVRLLLMFNPRHESGPVYLAERDRAAHVVNLTAFTHPNVITGENIVPGAVDRDTTLRRINEWTSPLAQEEKHDAECFNVGDECPFLVGTTTRSLAGEDYPPLPTGWRRILNPQFSYMVLGRYPAAAEGQLISRAWINRARDRWDDHVARHGLRPAYKSLEPVQGLDVAEMGSDSTVSCIRYGSFVLPLLAWGDTNVHQSAERAAQIHGQYKCKHTAVDGNGFGAGIAPRMSEDFGCEAYGVKVQSKPTYEVEEGEFDRMRDQLWWFVRVWLRHDPNAMLPPDPALEEELATPTYVVDRGKIKVMKKDEMKEKLRRSPDRAEALILTFFNESVEQEELLGPLGHAIFKHKGR